MRSRNFEVSILRNQSFSKQKFSPRFCLVQPHSSASNALHASLNDECSRTQASIVEVVDVEEY